MLIIFLITVPPVPALTVAVIFNESLSPADNGCTDQSGAFHEDPAEVIALPNVKSAGKTSVTTKFVTSSSKSLLVTITVYVIICPSSGVLSSTVFSKKISLSQALTTTASSSRTLMIHPAPLSTST